MKSNHYDTDLSINDCLAALLGLNYEHVRNGRHDYLLDEIEEHLSQTVDTLDRSIPPKDPEVLEALLEKAERISNRYSQAITFHTLITGEVARHRAGLPTDLVITKDSSADSRGYHQTLISRQSFIEWVLSTFNRHLTADELSDDDPTLGDDSPQGNVQYTDNEKDKHEVIIALLIEDLSQELKNDYLKAGKPNCAQLASRISESCRKQRITISGLSTESLRKKFSASMKKKEDYLPA